VSNLVLGIDEAGRGPALGAMVLAAVALAPQASRRLSRAGVADSKSFGAGPDAHQARLEMVRIIRESASFIALEVCDVEIIDAYVARGALNVLERERAERMIRLAPPCKRIIADGRKLFAALRATFTHMEAVDRGEEFHVAVAAASICAKVRRDELFACIAARYAHEFGQVGGHGYTNAATRAFTRAYVRKYGRLPPEARQSWPWPRHGGVGGHRVVATEIRSPLPSAGEG
jgi:ribonuclease HII